MKTQFSDIQIKWLVVKQTSTGREMKQLINVCDWTKVKYRLGALISMISRAELVGEYQVSFENPTEQETDEWMADYRKNSYRKLR